MKTSIILTIYFMLQFTLPAGAYTQSKHNYMKKENNTLETITLGGGCFWCIEAVFNATKGVFSAVSGYSGGIKSNPSYKEVSTGKTGHAEVVQINFDPSVISFEEILVIFFSVHDPTTLNRQGSDVGTQYRSVIFYHNSGQREKAEHMIQRLTQEKVYRNSIVTEVKPILNFFEAEDYHQEYFRNNPAVPYCNYVIRPKMDKFRAEYSRWLK